MKRRQLRQIHPQKKKLRVTKGTISLIVFGVLLAVQIFFTIQASSMGAELSVLEHQSMELTRKNQELKQALVNKSSLSQVQEKAEEIGYIKPSNVLFVKQDAPVAQLR